MVVQNWIVQNWIVQICILQIYIVWNCIVQNWVLCQSSNDEYCLYQVVWKSYDVEKKHKTGTRIGPELFYESDNDVILEDVGTVLLKQESSAMGAA